MVRVLATLCVAMTLGALSGVARADRLCPADLPPVEGPVCTGDLDDDPRCRGSEPGPPLPPATFVLGGKTSLTVSVAPALGGPSARLLGRPDEVSAALRPGHARRIERPPKLLPL